MFIQHNISAMNALRNTRFNNNHVSKNLEKLSSGFQINRAADDAAGLAISEKMRGQIRGLSQAQSNVNDGISLIKTMDGAMAEGHSILQRVRELLVQGSNGTYHDLDRQNIQVEIDHLMEEVDALSYRTEFNCIQVLRAYAQELVYVPPAAGGSDIAGTVSGGLPAWVDMDATSKGNMLIGNFVTTQQGFYSSGTLVPADPDDPDSYDTYEYTNTAYGTLDFSSLNAGNVNELVGEGFYHTCCTCTMRYSISFNDEGIDTVDDSSYSLIFNVDISGITTGEELVEKILSVCQSSFDHYTQIDVDQDNPAVLMVFDGRQGMVSSDGSIYGQLKPGVWHDDPNLGTPDSDHKIVESGTEDIVIQAGANFGETITIPIETIDTLAMGLRSSDNTSKISVLTVNDAADSISLIDNAINYISGRRASVGAIQNRLEHTLNNLKVSTENLQAAESSIRDVDMAKEMMEFTKHNILAQSAQSMLAQANQLPQGVLSLLR